MSSEDSLARLQLIDRLEVGPVTVEPTRLRAPYRVTIGGETDSTELSYVYEEPVFEAGDSAAVNLASIIAAQVALNYGLFCREIVLNGEFDRHDRRFLEEMARNTAREIYVNKLLMPNPFLRPEFRDLPVERRGDYLLAKMRFVGEAKKSAPWLMSRERHAILSSGGKDSLLTQGLLDEIGVETHPIFLNESGRHWFTAINAYRHNRDAVPNTARVWTDADRLFSWMVRRLPCIREDFSRLRSDEYPIRLWTVAVFLFGALPLLRKRGIGRLLIGDEFDTTLRLSHHGITHYGGLFDQSRIFDDALSRYFNRKGWSIAQFSILRPMSEILIIKTLAERYPELQRHQVSCHAAHLVDERALPCGRCEKCRRIVSMLVALGLDPGRCGYGEEQIERALRALPQLGLHQEVAGVEHLVAVLSEQGRLPSRASAGLNARRHDEVMHLRFSRTSAPFNAIPADLRRPLYSIMLDHAEGALRRHGRQWVEVDPFSSESLAAPYRFEPRKRLSNQEKRERGGEHTAWGAQTWPQAKERLANVDIVLLPVGAIEQHGPHLPLDVDAYDAERLCLEVAKACRPPRPLVLPLIPYGVSYHHDDFPGTVSVSPETLAQIIYEIGMDVARQGITKLIIVNGHGGNVPALQFAAQKINRDARIFTCVDTGETSDHAIEAIADVPNDVHAGLIETSTTLHFRPELVNMTLARPSVPHFSSDYLEFSSRRGVEWYVRTARISPEGVLGDPTKATPELGEQIWSIMIQSLVELVEHLAALSLDEIYQRRY